MRWHVVGAFGIMFEIVGVLRYQPIEKFFEIAPCRSVSILHHNQATTGVLRENCDNAVFNFALAYERFNFVGDFVGAFSCCCDGEILGHDRHGLKARGAQLPRQPTVTPSETATPARTEVSRGRYL